MQAHEIMTRSVHTVSPETSVREVAALMVTHRVSGIPVVDAGNQVLGMISEGDFLHRRENGTESRRRHSWWLDFLTDSRSRAREYAKSRGLRADEVMTSPAITVAMDTDIAEIADILDAERIKRVPVIHDGKLVGIVSRGDLVRVLAERLASVAAAPASDDDIRAELEREFRANVWSASSMINYSVSDRRVELWGAVADADQRNAIRVMAENIAGVRAVKDEMRIGRGAIPTGY